MPLKLSPIAVATCLALSACVGAGGLSYAPQVRTYPSYQPSDLSYAAGGKDLRTEIVGNPFGGPQAEFEAAVTAAMYRAHFGPAVNFTTAPGPQARQIHRLRLIFNGATASSGYEICDGDLADVPPQQVTGNVEVLAAFCRGSKPLTYLSAKTSGIGGANDPAFTAFMRQVAVLLFPPQNREIRDHRNCVPPGDC